MCTRLPIRSLFSKPLSTRSILFPTRTSTLSQNYQFLISCKPHPQIQTSRPASTITAPISSSTAAPALSTDPLTWNRFLQLRKTRRRINVVASLFSIAACISGSMYLISAHDVETLASQYLGLDSLIMMGIIVVGTTATGWLIGPFFGNIAFNLRYRSLRGAIMEKEKEFFTRIKKHRVDPTRSSYQNPVPDYYGEKIGSVQDYRRWLKDQRAFNLKREKMI